MRWARHAQWQIRGGAKIKRYRCVISRFIEDKDARHFLPIRYMPPDIFAIRCFDAAFFVSFITIFIIFRCFIIAISPWVVTLMLMRDTCWLLPLRLHYCLMPRCIIFILLRHYCYFALCRCRLRHAALRRWCLLLPWYAAIAWDIVELPLWYYFFFTPLVYDIISWLLCRRYGFFHCARYVLLIAIHY